MALASSVITRAIQIAKVGNVVNGQTVGFTTQALAELNSVLDHIARTVDFSAARAQFNFTFNTALVSSGSGNIITSAPQSLPIDYLRVGVSGGSTGAQRSSKWYIQGVPYDMVEIDLTEFDDQVQQAGIQSYPYFWAKDMSTRAIIANITGDLASNSTTVSNIASTTGITAGMTIAGGIGPLSGIVPGTTILTVGVNTLTLSTDPILTLAGASLIIGNPPVAYPYPPPSGAYPAMIRYQRVMPPLTQDQVDAGAYCWFDDDIVLVDLLSKRLMAYSDDSRLAEYDALARKALGEYTRLADDLANRSQTVSLDRRRFGVKFSGLRNTKRVGWLVLLSVSLVGMIGPLPC